MGKSTAALSIVLASLILTGCAGQPVTNATRPSTAAAAENSSQEDAAALNLRALGPTVDTSVQPSPSASPASPQPADPVAANPQANPPASLPAALDCPKGTVAVSVTGLHAQVRTDDPSGLDLVVTITVNNGTNARVWASSVVDAWISKPLYSHGPFTIPDLAPGQTVTAQATFGYVSRDQVPNLKNLQVDVDEGIWTYMDINPSCVEFTKSPKVSEAFATLVVTG